MDSWVTTCEMEEDLSGCLLNISDLGTEHVISEAAADMLSGDDSVTRDTWRGVTTVTRNAARDTG